LSVAQVVESANQIDDIATGLASREAVPEVFGDTDHEGRGVVATVDGAGTDEFITLFFEVVGQTLGSKDVGDRDGLLEKLEVEMGCDHDGLL
jgi:hypothetical protein